MTAAQATGGGTGIHTVGVNDHYGDVRNVTATFSGDIVVDPDAVVARPSSRPEVSR
jgi:hypothetical protein